MSARFGISLLWARLSQATSRSYVEPSNAFLNGSRAALIAVIVGGSGFIIQGVTCQSDNLENESPREVITAKESVKGDESRYRWSGIVCRMMRVYADTVPSKVAEPNTINQMRVVPILSACLPIACMYGDVPASSCYEKLKNIPTAQIGSFQIWDFTSCLWTIAFLGIEQQADFSNFCMQHLSQRINDLTAYDITVLLWFLAMSGNLTYPWWTQLLTWLCKRPLSEFDEAVVAHLFHAAYIAASNPEIISASKGKKQNQLGQWLLSDQPFPSLDDLEAVFKARPLPHKLWQRVEGAYRANSPLQPAQEAPLLAALHTAKMIPHMRQCIKDSASPYSSLLEPLGPLLDVAAKRASDILADTRQSNELARDITYHWRLDSGVGTGGPQAASNDIAHTLIRVMNVPAVVLADNVILIPHQRLALLLTGPDSVRMNSEDTLATGLRSLARLLQDRLVVKEFGCRTYEGFQAARVRMLTDKGWHTLTVDLGEYSKLPNQQSKRLFLEEVLRTRRI